MSCSSQNRVPFILSLLSKCGFCPPVISCFLAVSLWGLAGCDKAKEIADNAVNQVKEDFKKTKERVEEDLKGAKSAKPGSGKGDIPFSKPKQTAQSETPGGMSFDEFLNLGPSQVQDRHLASLASDSKVASSVRELKLSGARITSRGFETLKKFPNLERLDLTRVSATVGNMEKVGEVRWLKALDLSRNPLTNQDFDGIKTLTKLEEINISDTRITDEGFSCFKQMPNLSFMIMMQMSHLEGKGFKFVNKNSLKILHAHGSGIGQYAFASLGGSESLEILWLNGAQVHDKAMPGIGRCSNLRELKLQSNPISVKGVGALKGHRKLEVVVLAYNRQLNNQALGHLTKTKTLKTVNVHQTGCTSDVEAEFLKYVPGCTLVF